LFLGHPLPSQEPPFKGFLCFHHLFNCCVFVILLFYLP
jgi:hypothetical protein